ncbi:hypothetical protein PUN4_1000006 [Paraburkholderia unamae]|nr:hypothetical protein PUN4_1000006 [Paraburkholderia unamae]
MSASAILTIDPLLACIGANERCTRAEIIQRLGGGLTSVQHLLNICVAQGVLRRSREGRHHVWWKPESIARPPTQPAALLRGYDAQLQILAKLSATTRPQIRGQVIHYGVGVP